MLEKVLKLPGNGGRNREAISSPRRKSSSMSQRRLTPREFFSHFRTPQLAVDHYGPWLCAVGLTLFQIAGFFPLRYLIMQFNPFLGRGGFSHDFQFYLLLRTAPAFLWGSHWASCCRRPSIVGSVGR
jgi:hypothetical protein